MRPTVLDSQFATSGPPRITSKPTTAIGHEAATVNAEINPDQIETTYHFEYGETTEYGTEVPSGGASVGKGGTPVAVSAGLTGLKLGVTYHFRVVATNTAGTKIGPDETFTTVPPALVTSYATGVSATDATLNTTVNPLGNDTTYYFQYGTQPCAAEPDSCTSTPAPPGEDVGAGEEAVTKTLVLTGLEPETTYHYRVIAQNVLGETSSPEHTLVTQAPVQPLTLADNRAWEMVSPPEKGGAPVEALTREGGLILASEDGARLAYVVDGALGEDVSGNRSPEMQEVLATRSANAWSSLDIATPSTKAKGVSVGTSPEYAFFNPDLSGAVVEPFSPTGKAEPPLAEGTAQSTVYLRDNATGAFLPLVTEANTAPGTQFGRKFNFVSATRDLTHIVFTSTIALTGPGSAGGLYEWSEGELHFISLLPGNTTPSTPAELGYFGRVFPHAISDDGSRVIWTKKEENTGRGHLYMRDVAHGETIKLDAAQGVSEPEKGSAQYQAATSDGSRVFFTDKQRLTPDSTAEAAQGTGKSDLYECLIVEVGGKLTCNLSDLTVAHNEGDHAAVQNFTLGVGDDGSDIYFVAQGRLADNANGNGETAQAAKNNLYHLHSDGAQWTTTFVATLSSLDSPEWEGGTTHSNAAFLTARVSPNGRYLAFMSAAPITGYDNVDAGSAAKGARDEEVFLYDGDAAALRCVSCNASGARPSGVLDTEVAGEGLGLVVDRRKIWAEPGKEHWLAGNIPGWTAQIPAERRLPVALPLVRGAALLQQPRPARPSRHQRQEQRLRVRAFRRGQLREPLRRLRIADLERELKSRIGVHRSHSRREQRLLRNGGETAPAGHRHGIRHLRRAHVHGWITVPDDSAAPCRNLRGSGNLPPCLASTAASERTRW